MQSDSGHYFCSNIWNYGRPPYCSNVMRGKNILLKSIWIGDSPEAAEDVNSLPENKAEYKIAENEYCARHIPEKYDKMTDICMLGALDCCPLREGTCPLQYYVLFLGVNEGNDEDVQKWHSLKTIQDVLAVAKAEKCIVAEQYEDDHKEYVQFKQQGTKMQPALWFGYKAEAYKDRSYFEYYGGNHPSQSEARNVKMNQYFVTKHMKILLIDAMSRGDSNIDLLHFIPKGFKLPK